MVEDEVKELAMKEEFKALEKNQIWELVSILEDVKLIFCKWVYKIKRLSNGSNERYKAQHIARGFSHQYGLGYD